MKRRTVVIGLGVTAASGTALLASGAFSGVESRRDVRIQVAEDSEAYLGLSGTGSPNSDNYVSIDDDGHLAIDITGHDDFDGPDTQPGEGVNSDSFTWFDSMVQVCNQGTEAVGFYIEVPDDEDFPAGINATGDGPYDDEPRVQFYTGEAAGVGNSGTESVMGHVNAVEIPAGDCLELGLRTMTHGVDATESGPGQLFDDELILVAAVTIEGIPPADPVRNARTDATYTSIQAAVDDAEQGDTIEIRQATRFPENVEIDTSDITLQARSPTRPTLAGSVAVRAPGVGIVRTAIEVPDGEPFGIGIHEGAADTTIENGVVTGGEVAVAVGASDVVLRTLRLTGYNVGIFAGKGASVDVHQSTLENGVGLDGRPPVGIYVDRATGTVAHSRVAHNPGLPGESVASAGIVARGSTDLRVEENTVTGGDIGIEIHGARGGGGGYLATTTAISSTDENADSDATNTAIERNTVRDNGYSGIQINNGAVDTTVTENVIEANDSAGIAIDDRVLEGDPPASFAAPSNDIVDNGSYGIQNVVDEGIDATGCWWGDEGGPGVADTNGVFGEVTFEPWSTEPGPDWDDGGSS